MRVGDVAGNIGKAPVGGGVHQDVVEQDGRAERVVAGRGG